MSKILRQTSTVPRICPVSHCVGIVSGVGNEDDLQVLTWDSRFMLIMFVFVCTAEVLMPMVHVAVKDFFHSTLRSNLAQSSFRDTMRKQTPIFRIAVTLSVTETTTVCHQKCKKTCWLIRRNLVLIIIYPPPLRIPVANEGLGWDPLLKS